MPRRHKGLTSLLFLVAWFGHLQIVEMCRMATALHVFSPRVIFWCYKGSPAVSVPSPFCWQEHCTSCCVSLFTFVINASFLPEFLSQRVSPWRAWAATMTTGLSWPAHGWSIQRLMHSLEWFFTKGIILRSKYLKCAVLHKSPKGTWPQPGILGTSRQAFRKLGHHFLSLG